MVHALLWASAGTGFTTLMTTAGAAMVFFFRRPASSRLHQIMLGFAAGVMIASSMWSLLIPDIQLSLDLGGSGWLPAAGGSLLGILFLLILGDLLPHLAPESFLFHPDQLSRRRTAMLVLAVTLHNIPSGMLCRVTASTSMAVRRRES